MPERRQAVRTRVLQSGRIREGDTCVSTECRIVNRSPLGALLRVSDAVPVAAFFTLEVRGESFSAEMRWRQGEQVGVRFKGTRAEEVGALERARELHQERLENAALKNRERQLLRRLADLGYHEAEEF